MMRRTRDIVEEEKRTKNNGNGVCLEESLGNVTMSRSLLKHIYRGAQYTRTTIHNLAQEHGLDDQRRLESKVAWE